MWMCEFEVFEKIVSFGLFNVMLGEKGFVEWVVNLFWFLFCWMGFGGVFFIFGLGVCCDCFIDSWFEKIVGV